MTKWRPLHEKAARMKAAAVASYIKKYREIYGRPPILYYVARHFDRSETWASNYKMLAYEYGYL